MSCNPIDALPGHFRPHLPDRLYFWNLSGVSRGKEIEVTGWALPYGGEPGNVAITINGVPAEVEFSDAAGVAAEYKWWPNAAASGFCARAPDDGADEVVVSARPRSGAGPTYRLADTYWVRPGFPAEIPPAELLATIGGGDALKYRLGGRTLFRRFEAALKAATGQGFEAARSVIDWGCGPGRLAMHVIDQLGPESVTGFDIVETSIAFADGLHPGRFKVCGTEPPLPFDSGAADVLYGFSVFTHIPRALLPAWMAEVARVLRPGGIALVTTLSELAYAHFRAHEPTAEYERWRAAGVWDDYRNDQLKDTNVDADYYRNTFLSTPYFQALAGDGFETLARIPNFFFYQDLHVLRRR